MTSSTSTSSNLFSSHDHDHPSNSSSIYFTDEEIQTPCTNFLECLFPLFYTHPSSTTPTLNPNPNPAINARPQPPPPLSINLSLLPKSPCPSTTTSPRNLFSKQQQKRIPKYYPESILKEKSKWDENGIVSSISGIKSKGIVVTSDLMNGFQATTSQKRTLFPTTTATSLTTLSTSFASSPRTPSTPKIKTTFSPGAELIIIPPLPIHLHSEIWWSESDYKTFKRTGEVLALAIESSSGSVGKGSSGVDRDGWDILINNKTNQNQNQEKYRNPQDIEMSASTPNTKTSPRKKWWCGLGHTRRGIEHLLSPHNQIINISDYTASISPLQKARLISINTLNNSNGNSKAQTHRNRQQMVHRTIHLVLLEQSKLRLLNPSAFPDVGRIRYVSESGSGMARSMARVYGSEDERVCRVDLKSWEANGGGVKGGESVNVNANEVSNDDDVDKSFVSADTSIISPRERFTSFGSTDDDFGEKLEPSDISKKESGKNEVELAMDKLNEVKLKEVETVYESVSESDSESENEEDYSDTITNEPIPTPTTPETRIYNIKCKIPDSHSMLNIKCMMGSGIDSPKYIRGFFSDESLVSINENKVNKESESQKTLSKMKAKMKPQSPSLSPPPLKKSLTPASPESMRLKNYKRNAHSFGLQH